LVIETPVLERVLSGALQHGGDFAEVFAEDRSTSSAMLDDGRVEELSSGRERGAGIRVVSGETTGFAHTADLTEEGLLRAAEAASAVARSGAGGTRTVGVGPLTERDARVRSDAPDPRDAGSKGDTLSLLRRADEAARASGVLDLPGAGGVRELASPGSDRQLGRAAGR
jgi:TldD protein